MKSLYYVGRVASPRELHADRVALFARPGANFEVNSSSRSTKGRQREKECEDETLKRTHADSHRYAVRLCLPLTLSSREDKEGRRINAGFH